MEPEIDIKIYILYEENFRSLLIDYYQACFIRRACTKGQRHEVLKKKIARIKVRRETKGLLFFTSKVPFLKTGCNQKSPLVAHVCGSS